jgi:shikimate kinase
LVPEKRNIILTGFMGTGKSTVGKKLAARLGRQFLDTDALIEQESGMSIGQIFAEKGEPYFRTLETQMIARVCATRATVIATGGGAMVSEVNARTLKNSGTVICLTAHPEVILARVRGNMDRPLLQGENPLAKIQELLRTRAEAYARADMEIDTSQSNADEVVEAVLGALKNRALWRQ